MKSILALSIAAAFAIVPLTVVADDHTHGAAASAHAAGTAATEMANKSKECNANCTKEKDVKACTDKCTAQMNADHAKVMEHANTATDHAHAAAVAAAAKPTPAPKH